METSFLRGKVAKRIFALFVASALLPILILASLYQFQGSALLLEYAQGQLRGASATFGSAIYDRLVLADESLRGAIDELNHGASVESLRPTVDVIFSEIKILPYRPTAANAVENTWLGSLPARTRQRLLQGDTGLVTLPGPDKQARLVLVRLAVTGAASVAVSAEIRGQYLWSGRASDANLTEVCVFDQQFAALSCTETMELSGLTAALKQNAMSAASDLQWKTGDDAFVGHFRTVSLESRFTAPHWIVVASQRRSDALGSLKAFENIFWGSLAVSALLAALLSLVQIRRTMVPLDKLIQGTSKLSKQDFTTQVEILSNDEFQSLAQSFNTMARRLGRQFEVMTTLSSIDRAILYELDIDRVMEEVLSSLRAMYVLECAGVVVLDRESPGEERLYSLTRDRSRAMAMNAHSGAANGSMPLNNTELTNTELTNTDGYWSATEELGWYGAACKNDTAAHQFFSFPFGSKAGPRGQLMLGFETRLELDQDDVGYIREFADRIGVALSSAARDEQLFRQARYDGLTGLPNRHLLIERLKQEVAQAQRYEKPFSVLYVDLDRFKQVNDSLGHTGGDQLLQEAAQRLRDCVRGSDTVARVGGDEFTIVLSGNGDATVASTVADHVLAAMAKSFTISGIENFVSASVGIAIYPQDGADPGELLRNADTALYRAKAAGKGIHVFFEDDMNAEVMRIATLDRELRYALSENQLLLYYQPQIDLRTGSVRAVEALVRWEHPQRGVIMPGHFMDFAEDSGLIVALGELVLVQACRQYRSWREMGLGIHRIAINVSGRQFRQNGFADMVKRILDEAGVPGTALTFEITENTIIEDIEVVKPLLDQLRSLGVRIALDDFGTGFSSMSYLEKLPVDTLKIDRSFITTIDEAGRGGVIAKLVLDMARALKMRVVAEGLERLEQLKFLNDHQCNAGQGYLFSRPLPADELTDFLAKWNLVKRQRFFPHATRGISSPTATAW